MSSVAEIETAIDALTEHEREALEALGWRVIVITAEGMRQPYEVVWRVYRALRDRGYDGPPPHFNDMWNYWFAAD